LDLSISDTRIDSRSYLYGIVRIDGLQHPLTWTFTVSPIKLLRNPFTKLVILASPKDPRCSPLPSTCVISMSPAPWDSVSPAPSTNLDVCLQYSDGTSPLMLSQHTAGRRIKTGPVVSPTHQPNSSHVPGDEYRTDFSETLSIKLCMRSMMSVRGDPNDPYHAGHL
jgi:hypothetical protein